MKLNRILRILPFLFSAAITACMAPKAAKIKKTIRESPVLNDHFTGFALYDLTNSKTVAEVNSSLYFTPASNTKLFTFYAALHLLGDSIPALQYVERGDSLIFWGTGDPTFLYPGLDNGRAFNFLKNSAKKLFFAYGRYTGDFFGNGWQWDDYNGSYQPEMTELPLFENSLHVKADASGKLWFSPASLANTVHEVPGAGSFALTRNIFRNRFTYPGGNIPKNFAQQVPLRMDSSTLFNLLRDTLNVPVEAINMGVPREVKTIYSVPSDTVYRHMLQPSDNFIAEHLLLLCAVAQGTEMNTAAVIKLVNERYLKDLPDAPRWADGSGLSRMNLFTPRDMVVLLRKIYGKIENEDRLFGLLSAGGRNGTMKSIYKSKEPFVFGKTGSLSNNYNQSGYILTKKGNRLVYSFMNNNFTRPTAEVRTEMERVITYIYTNY